MSVQPNYNTVEVGGVKHIMRVDEPSSLPTTIEPNQPRIGQNDAGNALRFAKLHGDSFRYTKVWGWLYWDSQRWATDETGRVMSAAKQTACLIGEEASHTGIDEQTQKLLKWASTSLSRQRLDAMIELAKSELPAVASEFDTDPWLLNCANGTLDLKTGTLRQHPKEDYITKLCPVEYHPAETCPTWLSFLDRIFKSNKSLIDFVQRAAGYSLTGSTGEQVLFFCYGTGANGKTTMLEVLGDMLGDYAARARFETFLVKRGGGANNDVARLAGARFVASIEAQEGRQLAEGTVKSLTGGDTVTARFLYHEDFEYRPQFKLWLAANHRPVVNDTSEAMWRRIRQIPFDVMIPEAERDSSLPDKLREELPGILAWAVRGCLGWQAHGLGTPEAVKQATAAYRSEMDTLAQFIEECCIKADKLTAQSSTLYAEYQKWCQESGEKAEPQKRFNARLEERGFTKTKNKNGHFWHGIGLVEK